MTQECCAECPGGLVCLVGGGGGVFPFYCTKCNQSYLRFVRRPGANNDTGERIIIQQGRVSCCCPRMIETVCHECSVRWLE